MNGNYEPPLILAFSLKGRRNIAKIMKYQAFAASTGWSAAGVKPGPRN